MILYDESKHEKIKEIDWNESFIKTTIQDILCKLENAIGGSSKSLSKNWSIYRGLEGDIWAYEKITKKMNLKSNIDAYSVLSKIINSETLKIGSEFDRASFFSGMVGVFTLYLDLFYDPKVYFQLLEHILKQLDDGHNDIMYGVPGLALGLITIADSLQSKYELDKSVADKLFKSIFNSWELRSNGTHYWKQQYKNSSYKCLGASHGVTGNVSVLLSLSKFTSLDKNFSDDVIFSRLNQLLDLCASENDEFFNIPKQVDNNAFLILKGCAKFKLNPANTVAAYRNRNKGIEGCFKFLKRQDLNLNQIFLKSESRIEAMMIVMALILFVNNLAEKTIRDYLCEGDLTFPNQFDIKTTKPTFK